MAVILIVEDDVLMCELTGILVADFGHQTFSASGVDDALLLLNSSQHIDAVFADICLNDDVFGGIELTQHAIKSRPSLRVLYTSGNDIPALQRSMFVEGSSFLLKPYTGTQLQNTLTMSFSA